MSEFLFENPLILGFVGAIVTVLTLFGWVQTGNKYALYGGGICLLATILLVWLNIAIVTDKEQIRKMLGDTALELERNNVVALKSRLHPDHSQSVVSAMAMLPRVKFEVAQVTRIHSIEFHKVGSQQAARVRMNVYVEVQSDIMPGKIPRWVQLDLEKSQDKWLVVDFDHKDPTFEFMGRE
jgi:hypothetical protein